MLFKATEDDGWAESQMNAWTFALPDGFEQVPPLLVAFIYRCALILRTKRSSS